MYDCVAYGVAVAVREPNVRRRSLLAVAALIAVAAVAPAVPAAAEPAASVAAKPTGLHVASAAHDSITIAWDDPGDATISGYRILRRLRDTYEVGRFDTIAVNTGTADTTYTDTDVTAETRYVYRVKAINPAGTSKQSTFLRARTSPPPPSDNNNGDDSNDGDGGGDSNDGDGGATTATAATGAATAGRGRRRGRRRQRRQRRCDS